MMNKDSFVKNLKNKSKIGATILVFLTACTNAVAFSNKNPFDYQYKGWYLNAGLGYNFNSGGGGVAEADLGYQFNRYFALEAGYFDVFSWSGWNWNSNGAHLSAKGIFPVSDKLDLFGRLGGAYTTATGYGALLGVGTSYHLTEKLSLDFSINHLFDTNHYYIRYGTVQNMALTYGLVGLGYKF